jgi:hypothetical protein
MVHQTHWKTYSRQQPTLSPQVRKTYETLPCHNTQLSELSDNHISSVPVSVNSAFSVASLYIQSTVSATATRAKLTSPGRHNTLSLPPHTKKVLVAKLLLAVNREVPLSDFCYSRKALFGTFDYKTIGNRYQIIAENKKIKFFYLCNHHNLTIVDSITPSAATADTEQARVQQEQALSVQQEDIISPPAQRRIAVMSMAPSSITTKYSGSTHGTEDSKRTHTMTSSC